MAGEIATWVGVPPGVFATNTNWSPVNVLEATDILSANGDNSVPMAGADHGGILLGSLTTLRGYVGDIGSSATPLTIDAVALTHKGLGTLWMRSEGSGGVTTDIVIDSPNMVNAATLSGEAASSASFTNITCLNGKTTLEGTISIGATTARLVIGSKTNSMGMPRVVINEKSGAPQTAIVTDAMQFGGHTDCVGTITVLRMNGGRWFQTVEKIVTIYQTGGYLGYGAEQTNGTITAAYIYGGEFDTTHLARGVTITDLFHYPGAKIFRDPELLTITNEHDFGGDIINKRATVDLQSAQLIGGGRGNV